MECVCSSCSDILSPPPPFPVFPERLSNLVPSGCPQLMVLAIAGPMAAATASTITNPMDVVRARVQVSQMHMEQ